MKVDPPDKPLLHARRGPGRPRVHPIIKRKKRRRGRAHYPSTPASWTSYKSQVSPWTIRSLEWSGVLPRVRIPLADVRDLRKLLFDRAIWTA